MYFSPLTNCCNLHSFKRKGDIQASVAYYIRCDLCKILHVKMAEKPDENKSSQLDEDDLRRMEEDSKPENTEKQTAWGIKEFNDWCALRKVDCNLNTVSSRD